MNILIKNLKKIGIIFPLALVLSSCLDDNVKDQNTNDDELIEGYLATNNLTAERTDAGLYYTVITEGNGAVSSPDLIHDISYDLSFLETGQTVENLASYKFLPSVGSFAPGLTQGVQLMQEGDNYRFYIPSRLAFGANSGNFNTVFVPSNSNFIADVTLNDLRTEAEQKELEVTLLRSYVDSLEGILSVDERPSGVIKAVINEGLGGDSPSYGSFITVAYNGSLLDGLEFDRNAEFTIALDTTGLIKGWYDGISQMQIGEEAWILIPSDRGYGASGSLEIPPFEPLRFRVKLLSFQ